MVKLILYCLLHFDCSTSAFCCSVDEQHSRAANLSVATACVWCPSASGQYERGTASPCPFRLHDSYPASKQSGHFAISSLVHISRYSRYGSWNVGKYPKHGKRLFTTGSALRHSCSADRQSSTTFVLRHTSVIQWTECFHCLHFQSWSLGQYVPSKLWYKATISNGVVTHTTNTNNFRICWSHSETAT
jgi:hypothetical protein